MQNIKKQKLKLTIFFSLLVFLLAIFLEGVFFSFKYFNEKNVDKNIFVNQTKILLKKIDKQKDILALFEDTFLDDNLGKLKNLKHNSHKISFIILDKNNEVIDKKILENIDFKILENIGKNKIYFKNNYFILEKKLKNHILGEKIFFYKKLNYAKIDLLKDISLFIFITFLSSIIFFVIGKKFVDKNLRPVEENIIDMENFIHNASHEFKTPISIINSNLQIIKAEKKYDEELVLENLKVLDNFNNLINTLTQLSGINLDNIPILNPFPLVKRKGKNEEKINLKKEIPEIIAENIGKIKEKKLKIKFIIQNKKFKKIFGNKQHFRILFQNLLQNAIKYNNIGGEIKIILEKNKLIIKDNGIGIEKENIGKIFDRFYRENNSKTGSSFGIGLSLVDKICKINNWKISIESQKGEGTEFIIKF